MPLSAPYVQLILLVQVATTIGVSCKIYSHVHKQDLTNAPSQLLLHDDSSVSAEFCLDHLGHVDGYAQSERELLGEEMDEDEEAEGRSEDGDDMVRLLQNNIFYQIQRKGA